MKEAAPPWLAVAERWRIFRTDLRRWMRPPRELKTTPFGWFFLAVTLGVGVSAINAENNLLYIVLGLLLGFIAASGMLSEMSLRGLAYECAYPDDPEAGKPFLYEIRIRNNKRSLPSFAVQIEDRASGKRLATSFVFRIAAGETVTKAVQGQWSARGVVPLTDMRMSTRFPFGLFEKAVVRDDARELIMLPADLGVTFDSPTTRSWQGFQPSGVAGEGSELFALRPWQESDGYRNVHWKKSASGAGMQSKVREAEEKPRVVLALIPGLGPDLEQAVSQAAKWVRHMDSGGFQVGLVAGDSRIAPAAGASHRLRLLRSLAVFDGRPPVRLDGSEKLLTFQI